MDNEKAVARGCAVEGGLELDLLRLEHELAEYDLKLHEIRRGGLWHVDDGAEMRSALGEASAAISRARKCLIARLNRLERGGG